VRAADKKPRSREAFAAVFEEQTRRFSAFELLGLSSEAVPSSPTLPSPVQDAEPEWLAGRDKPFTTGPGRPIGPDPSAQALRPNRPGAVQSPDSLSQFFKFPRSTTKFFRSNRTSGPSTPARRSGPRASPRGSGRRPDPRPPARPDRRRSGLRPDGPAPLGPDHGADHLSRPCSTWARPPPVRGRKNRPQYPASPITVGRMAGTTRGRHRGSGHLLPDNCKTHKLHY
jgi:hypothetical protein